jgi:hypothetical protein
MGGHLAAARHNVFSLCNETRITTAQFVGRLKIGQLHNSVIGAAHERPP